jgi:hypothetical protein
MSILLWHMAIHSACGQALYASQKRVDKGPYNGEVE